MRPPRSQAAGDPVQVLIDVDDNRYLIPDLDEKQFADMFGQTLAYGLFAAQIRQDETRADELWRTLYGHAQLNTGHALFAASTLYSWGRVTEPEALWWRAADQEGGNAIQALGALAPMTRPDTIVIY